METVSGGVPAQSVVRRSVVPSWGELWQIPLFCLGILSVVLVLAFRPAHAKSIPAARDCYNKAWLALDLDDLANAQRWLQNLEQNLSDRSVNNAQVEFLRGSILLAKTWEHYPLPVKTPAAKQEYQSIKEGLEKITNSLSQQEQARLEYRLLILKLAIEGIQLKILDQLEQLLDIDFADRRDGYQLLSQMRLRTEPIDLLGSLRAVDRLLTIPELARPNAARLQKAQLLVQLEKWNDVIKICRSIPVDADEYAAALQPRALAAYHLQLWGEADEAWKLVKEAQQTPSMLLYYGLCQQQLKKAREATKLWERLRIVFPGAPEALKATLCLSQLSIQQGRWPDAVSYLITILHSHKRQPFDNPYVSADEIWQQVSECAESLIKLHRWKDVRLLAEEALPWSQKGKAESWLSLAWHNLAELARIENPALVPQREAFHLAAEYAWRAAKAPGADNKERWLELAGNDALQAQDYPSLAQRAFGEWLTVPPAAAKRGAVLIGLAAALQAQGQLDDARDRLREACQVVGDHEATAHLRLYYLLKDQKQWNDAERELDQAVKFVTRPQHNPDAEAAAHERLRFLYFLYSLSPFDRRTVLPAIEAGEIALKYADKHALAPQSRYLLAELLEDEGQQLINEKLDDGTLQKKAAQFFQALAYFQAAARDLAQPGLLGYKEETRLTMTRFSRLGQADCLFYLGKLARYAPLGAPKADACWLQAGQIFQEMAAQSDSKLERLNCLYWLAQCQLNRGLILDMRDTISSALQFLDAMIETDFQQLPSIRAPGKNRNEWKALFEDLLQKNPQ